MNSDHRPDPEALLREIEKAHSKAKRGKLKIFFGMCPGVGKTFAMLKAAQKRKSLGTRVLVGLIETHRRAETEKLIEGLDLIPRRRLEHRGTQFEEFDLDYALELKPELILVDELAHTNAPGSKHSKRYQDVKDLLFAGIDVYTTMNVQHVESRADLVYQISGVPVRETVPDGFLELADQIELIDLSPEDLLQRLKEGKIYLGERADRAAENFFKEEKLTALRELALRFTAEVVDDHLRDHMQSKRILGPWNTNERLMVAISHSPMSARLIRAARRMAYNLEAPWVALYVDTGAELSARENETLTKNLNLAHELGAEVVTTRDHSIVEALKRMAAERNVTQIIMGRPDRRLFRDFFNRGNILDQLVNETSEVDIHLVRQKRKPIYRGFHFRLPRFSGQTTSYFKTALFMTLLSLTLYPIRAYVGYRAIGFAFLLAILPVATLAGLGPILLGAGLSAIIWDFFFIPPQFTLDVKEPEDGMMILAYFAVASVAGYLASRIKKQEKDLLQRERRANILYDFGKMISNASSTNQIVDIAVKSIEAIFKGKTIILLSEENTLNHHVPYLSEQEISENEFAVATWAYENQKKAGWNTDTLASANCLCVPLRGRTKVVGVLILYPKGTHSFSLDQENLIETIASNLAVALERLALEAASRRAEVYEKSEKLHQALLNSVSHELRTPLTSIMGGATSLSQAGTFQNESLRTKIMNDVIHAAERLTHTVENLMDMSRISSGALRINDDFFELNDFIRSWLQRNERFFVEHTVVLELSEDDLFVKGDEKLLEHVLNNLVGNAAKYSPLKSKITIRSRRHLQFSEFSVIDEGRGILKADLQKVFEQFYRAPDSPPGGVGLGLSIAKAIIEAHQGLIFASNRNRHAGSEFTVRLPYQLIPNEVLQ